MDISLDDFREEMAERLIEWENCVLDYENQPEDKVIINNLFRVVHTVKGVSGTCGYHNIMRLTHELESYLDDVRRGNIKAAAGFVDIILQGCDIIRRMAADHPDSTAYTESTTTLLSLLKSLSTTVRAEIIDKTEVEKSSYRYLRKDTVNQLRTEVLLALNKKEEFRLDLSDVQECDSEGIHFLCSLVPVFVRSTVPLTVVGLSDTLITTSFSQGIDIRNVLKRASIGSNDPSKGHISHFTVTLHPADSASHSVEMGDAYQQFREYLLKHGSFSENCYVDQGTKKNCTLLIATTLTRNELEKSLEKLPETILWTISLTPDQGQKNDAIRRISNNSSSITDTSKLMQRWRDRLERLWELTEMNGNNDQLMVVRELRDVQKKICASTTKNEDLPLSLFLEALKTIRGE